MRPILFMLAKYQNILHDISISYSLIDYSEKTPFLNTNIGGAFTATLCKNEEESKKYKNTKFLKALIFLTT